MSESERLALELFILGERDLRYLAARFGLTRRRMRELTRAARAKEAAARVQANGYLNAIRGKA